MKKFRKKVKEMPFASFANVRVTLKWLPILTIIACVILIVGLAYNLWLPDLVISFIPQVLIVILGAAMTSLSAFIFVSIRVDDYFAIKKNRIEFKVLVTSFVALLLLASVVFSRGIPKENGPSGENLLSVATFNILFSNKNVEPVVEQLENESVSVAAFQEINESEVEKIKSALGFEHSYVSNQDISAFETEIAIVSKYPIVSAGLISGYENGGIIRAEILVGDELLSFYAVHFTPPYSNNAFEERSELYRQATESVLTDKNRAFLMGDFNTTVFSQQLVDFREAVEDKMKISGVRRLPHCSWYGYGDIACMRIDHVFIPADMKVEDVKIGEHAGSDHRPVIVDLSY